MMTDVSNPAASPAIASAPAEPVASSSLYEYARNPQPSTFEYFTERYYHQYCIEDCKKIPGNTVRILQHSNGLCVVCLDPEHAALRAMRADASLRIASIVFGSGRNNSAFSPDSIKVVGKRKKNALLTQIDTKLCTVTMSDGTVYPVPACLNGYILELNAALLDSPWLAAAAPTAEGFLAVVNPSAKNDYGAMKKVWTATGGDAQGEDED